MLHWLASGHLMFDTRWNSCLTAAFSSLPWNLLTQNFGRFLPFLTKWTFWILLELVHTYAGGVVSTITIFFNNVSFLEHPSVHVFILFQLTPTKVPHQHHSKSSLASPQSQQLWASSVWSTCARPTAPWCQIAALCPRILKKKTSMTLTERMQEDGTERASMGMGIKFMWLTQTHIMTHKYQSKDSP